ARLRAELRSDDGRRRWGAAYALALVDVAFLDAVPVLLDALGSSDGDLPWASARLLTRPDRATAGLGDALASLVGTASPLQRKMALYCLRDLAGTLPADRAVLTRALDDPEASVRLAAMAAVAARLPATVETADLLASLVDDQDAGVQRAAAATL